MNPMTEEERRAYEIALREHDPTSHLLAEYIRRTLIAPVCECGNPITVTSYCRKCDWDDDA